VPLKTKGRFGLHESPVHGSVGYIGRSPDSSVIVS